MWLRPQNGVLDKYNVELLGAKLPSINRAEDRSLFKDAMKKIGLKTPSSGIANTWEEALQVHQMCNPSGGPPSQCGPQHDHLPFSLCPHPASGSLAFFGPPTAFPLHNSAADGCLSEVVVAGQVHKQIGRFPLIIRPAFTLGGTGGGIAYNMEEYEMIINQGLDASLTSQARQHPLPCPPFSTLTHAHMCPGSWCALLS